MTGKKHIDRLIIAISLFASILAAGIYVYTELIYQKKLPDNEAEFEDMKDGIKNRLISGTYKLQKITVNLKSRSTKLRFLDVEIHIVPFAKSYTRVLDKNRDVVYDSIIDITSGMNPEELNTVSGKILLENRIKNDLNKILKKQIVKEILFTTFIIM